MPSFPEVLLLLLFAAAVPSAADAECRYFWVVRDGLSSPETVDSLLQRASLAGANGVVVQVCGRGEAYYRSEILPSAGFSGFTDPLAYTIMRAGPMGLEVHAWVNAFLVWSADTPPASRYHVVNAHPEWFTAHSSGKSTLSYTRSEAEAAGLVGATLSPACGEVRDFVADVAEEIALNYNVTGIHLDYIRYPGASFGFAPLERELFYSATGLDCMESPDEWSRWKTAQVTETVATVRSVLRSANPEVVLSCAVMANPHTAVSEFSCDWRSWLEDGLIDYAFPMAYTSSRERAAELADVTTVTCPERVVYGIGVWNQTVGNALAGAERALENGAKGVCVFSLNSLPPRGEELLRESWGSSGMPEHGVSPAVFSRVVVE